MNVAGIRYNCSITPRADPRALGSEGKKEKESSTESITSEVSFTGRPRLLKYLGPPALPVDGLHVWLDIVRSVSSPGRPSSGARS
jgi:hypothetical protein